MVDAVVLTRGQRSLYIQCVSLQHADMRLIVAEHIRQLFRLLAVGQDMVGTQEGTYLAKRQRRDRIGLVLVTALGSEVNHRLAPLHRFAEARLAIDPAQMQHVTGIDPVRVGNLGIDVPETGPEPGLCQISA